ncbi:MAG: GntR family transcriptional regulator [Eubacteriales bacterium]|uniref:GntR family transcriptional regulator n=1 Tax=Baileyella intestinalis TaxID=2606709 RepID=A0A6A8M625_9FIRM|nr:GntR family transcriptional regulator [Baileyella intestinalis]MDD5874379.1 GntR family transcriptional regulator [Baileyella intestinalis]MST68150.1 GntR family transcriptional regulator [Baileyella intestinalis]
MHILINHSSMVPIYEQVADQVKKNIISGELKEGQVLPSVRALSSQLRISALTVKKSYDRLEDEGFVVTVQGKGTYVSTGDLSFAEEARRRAVEDDFKKAVDKATAAGMRPEEILEIVKIMLEV